MAIASTRSNSGCPLFQFPVAAKQSPVHCVDGCEGLRPTSPPLPSPRPPYICRKPIPISSTPSSQSACPSPADDRRTTTRVDFDATLVLIAAPKSCPAAQVDHRDIETVVARSTSSAPARPTTPPPRSAGIPAARAAALIEIGGRSARAAGLGPPFPPVSSVPASASAVTRRADATMQTRTSPTAAPTRSGCRAGRGVRIFSVVCVAHRCGLSRSPT